MRRDRRLAAPADAVRDRAARAPARARDAVAEDLPGVGRNLQDHLGAPTLWATGRPVSLYAADSPRSLLRYALRRRGLLTSNVGEAAAFVRSDPRLSAPDLELLFAPVVFAGEGLERPPRHGFTIGVLALQPASRGGVALASADPLGHTAAVAAVVGERAADLMLRGREDATTWKRQVVGTEPR